MKPKDIKKNIVGWFEIPVTNMDRAISFYESVFDLKLTRSQLGPLDMAWFPWEETGIGSPGGLVYYEQQYIPSSQVTRLKIPSCQVTEQDRGKEGKRPVNNSYQCHLLIVQQRTCHKYGQCTVLKTHLNCNGKLVDFG